MGLKSWLFKTFKGVSLKSYNKLNNELMLSKNKIEELERYIEICRSYIPVINDNYKIEDSFQSPQFANAVLQKLIKDYEFNTVLDIGAGSMSHSIIFSDFGKKVTAIDFGVSVYYKEFQTEKGGKINQIIGDFNKVEIIEQFDCIFAAHILEHQPDVDLFLKKVISLTKEGGVIAITVPPFKHEIVGGHVSFWNAGLIMYRLVLCGIDCSEAAILSYGYNISVIVKKKTISLQGIEYDCGDIRRIKQYLPKELEFNPNENDDPFNGNISRLNW